MNCERVTVTRAAEHACATIRDTTYETGTGAALTATGPLERNLNWRLPLMAHDSRTTPASTTIWPAPLAHSCILPADEATLPATVRLGLPASWEDCVALGLDPLGAAS